MINYYLLTKPGILLGNLLTFASGFLLASKGVIDPQLFFMTLLGLTAIMASACVFNNYIDRHTDKKMERTKKRALAQGLISKNGALFFGTLLGVLGSAILFVGSNFLALSLAAIGFFVYVVLYSFWKGHTIYGTAIGSIAGATPPVVGYSAFSNQLDLGAVLLFGIMVLWQMPHFFSIAIYHLRDYRQAAIPVLPLKKGVFRTKIQMAIYILGFIFMGFLLSYMNYTGYFYLIALLSSGFLWLGFCIGGFITSNDEQWGKVMFRLSLFAIVMLCLTIPF